MYVQTAFRNTRRFDDLGESAVEKISAQVRKFVAKPVGIEVTFQQDSDLHIVHCHIKAGDGFSVYARESAENFNEAIDKLVAKVSRQLHKKKSRMKPHHERLTIFDVAEEGKSGTAFEWHQTGA